VVSSNSRFGDIDGNLEHFEKLVEKAADRKAQLVCFPELALTGYATSKTIVDYAQTVPGPATGKLAEIARSHNVYVSAGMAEKEGDAHYIAQVLVGPAGYIGKYRKHFPTGPAQACGFSPGIEFPVWEVHGFRLGFNICADGRQASTLEGLKKAEVEVIHHPHGNWLALGRDAEEWTRGKIVYFVPRAVSARAYILINNSAGDTMLPEGASSFGSGALAIDPLGQVMDRTRGGDRDEKMIVVTLRKPLSELIPPFEMERIRDGR
jgi:predicted amidohydrolase